MFKQNTDGKWTVTDNKVLYRKLIESKWLRLFRMGSQTGNYNQSRLVKNHMCSFYMKFVKIILAMLLSVC